jgi:hypothetical protein
VCVVCGDRKKDVPRVGEESFLNIHFWRIRS